MRQKVTRPSLLESLTTTTITTQSLTVRRSFYKPMAYPPFSDPPRKKRRLANNKQIQEVGYIHVNMYKI